MRAQIGSANATMRGKEWPSASGRPPAPTSRRIARRRRIRVTLTAARPPPERRTTQIRVRNLPRLPTLLSGPLTVCSQRSSLGAVPLRALGLRPPRVAAHHLSRSRTRTEQSTRTPPSFRPPLATAPGQPPAPQPRPRHVRRPGRRCPGRTIRPFGLRATCWRGWWRL